PIPGDKMKAYITGSKGASVHRADCSPLAILEGGRIAKANWEKDFADLIRIAIQIKSIDRVGLLKDITSVITDYGINILSFDLGQSRKNDILNSRVIMEIKNLDQLVDLLHSIERLNGVIDAKRL